MWDDGRPSRSERGSAMSCLPIETASDGAANHVAAGDGMGDPIPVARAARAESAGHSDAWVGTSGWSYASWRGPFFPRDLPARRHLGFYSGRFPTTELNGVFYRTPTEQAVCGWTGMTPIHFLFAWQASK